MNEVPRTYILVHFAFIPASLLGRPCIPLKLIPFYAPHFWMLTVTSNCPGYGRLLSLRLSLLSSHCALNGHPPRCILNISSNLDSQNRNILTFICARNILPLASPLVAGESTAKLPLLLAQSWPQTAPAGTELFGNPVVFRIGIFSIEERSDGWRPHRVRWHNRDRGCGNMRE